MKNNKTPQTALFCDCETDAERAEFFACGRAVETGVVAPAIAQQIADVYECADELLAALKDLLAALPSATTHPAVKAARAAAARGDARQSWGDA